jgi:hypothetical protein
MTLSRTATCFVQPSRLELIFVVWARKYLHVLEEIHHVILAESYKVNITVGAR